MIYIAMWETPSFRFVAIERSRRLALDAIERAWRLHCDETQADPTLFDRNEVNVIVGDPGDAFRDGSLYGAECPDCRRPLQTGADGVTLYDDRLQMTCEATGTAHRKAAQQGAPIAPRPPTGAIVEDYPLCSCSNTYLERTGGRHMKSCELAPKPHKRAGTRKR